MARMISIASVQLPAFAKGPTDADKKENNFQSAEYWLHQAGQRHDPQQRHQHRGICVLRLHQPERDHGGGAQLLL